MRRTLQFLVVLGILAGSVTGLLISSGKRGPDPQIQAKQDLVRALGLTDLALCSEARYTRHPTQADLFSAFQDSPAMLEHFPTGSLILPRPKGFNSRVIIDRSDRAVN